MKVNYCDLCSQPLKDEYYVLYSHHVSPTHKQLNEMTQIEYENYITTVNKKSKEICIACNDMLNRIFTLRLERISELALDIKKIYDKDTKVPPHEQKKKRKKK